MTRSPGEYEEQSSTSSQKTTVGKVHFPLGILSHLHLENKGVAGSSMGNPFTVKLSPFGGLQV